MLNCPKCGSDDICRDSVDVGVGVIYGPYGCSCGWSEWSEYDRSDGQSQAEKENPGYYVDSCGGMTKKTVIAKKLDHFGLDGNKIIEEFFDYPDSPETCRHGFLIDDIQCDKCKLGLL